MRLTIPVLVFALLLLFGMWGCSQTKENCVKLLDLACEHAKNKKKDEGETQCVKLKELSESVSDKSCAETLRLLKESGQLQKKRK